MVTPEDCIKKYGKPTPDFERIWMGMYFVPKDIHEAIKPLPGRIYCNRDFWAPFINSLKLVIERGLQDEITEYGGIFNIRLMRGGSSYSIHSWAIAVDINMSTNQLGQPPQMSEQLVNCFKENDFDWGGDWQRKDGMHFQLSKI